MSKYGLTQTLLREEKYLVEALKEMGYEVEVHPEGVPLTRTTRNKKQSRRTSLSGATNCVELAAILDSPGNRTVGSR